MARGAAGGVGRISSEIDRQAFRRSMIRPLSVLFRSSLKDTASARRSHRTCVGCN